MGAILAELPCQRCRRSITPRTATAAREFRAGRVLAGRVREVACPVEELRAIVRRQCRVGGVRYRHQQPLGPEQGAGTRPAHAYGFQLLPDVRLSATDRIAGAETESQSLKQGR